MGKLILLILAGYFVILGLISVIEMIVRLCRGRTLPEGMLYLRAPEDPGYTEGSLYYYYNMLCREQGLAGRLSVIYPQNAEAGEICRIFCRDHDLPLCDLPPSEECIIMEPSDARKGENAGGAEDGTIEGDGGGYRFPQ